MESYILSLKEGRAVRLLIYEPCFGLRSGAVESSCFVSISEVVSTLTCIMVIGSGLMTLPMAACSPEIERCRGSTYTHIYIHISEYSSA